MSHYLFKFIFYTSGVIGLLLIAYVFAKSCLSGGIILNKKKGNLEIEETLGISPRKTLHIVRAFDEKFLIASDANSTVLLAKLGDNGEIAPPKEVVEEFSSLLEEKPARQVPLEKTESVIQSMLEKLNK